jgi:hypothetical protein
MTRGGTGTIPIKKAGSGVTGYMIALELTFARRLVPVLREI